jgi:predicted NAD/FAD-binding protein
MKKLAIIGAGIAGLGCAHKLSRQYDLTIFESNSYLGGHTNTIDVAGSSDVVGSSKVAFDTGFMVYNHITYPNLTALFSELNVPTKKTDMSFSVQYLPDKIEWNGAGLDRIFAQRKNLVSPRFWRMLLKLDWFNKNALLHMDNADLSTDVSRLSVRDYVSHFKLGEDFLHWYLIPMASAVWSTPPNKVQDFPIATLIRFFHNHGFLGLDTHFQWYTVDGGAREYVKRLLAALSPTTQFSSGVKRVERLAHGARVHTERGFSDFDKVIFACHADQALALISEPTALECRLLTPFKYQDNSVTVHTDRRVMPTEPKAWASWNYRIAEQSNTHYWMNNLQGLKCQEDYFVSLNSDGLIDPGKIVRQLEYTHPLFDLATFEAQPQLPQLNSVSPKQALYFCGSYFRYGFHEDALASAYDLSDVLSTLAADSLAGAAQ